MTARSISKEQRAKSKGPGKLDHQEGLFPHALACAASFGEMVRITKDVLGRARYFTGEEQQSLLKDARFHGGLARSYYRQMVGSLSNAWRLRDARRMHDTLASLGKGVAA